MKQLKKILSILCLSGSIAYAIDLNNQLNGSSIPNSDEVQNIVKECPLQKLAETYTVTITHVPYNPEEHNPNLRANSIEELTVIIEDNMADLENEKVIEVVGLCPESGQEYFLTITKKNITPDIEIPELDTQI